MGRVGLVCLYLLETYGIQSVETCSKVLEKSKCPTLSWGKKSLALARLAKISINLEEKTHAMLYHTMDSTYLRAFQQTR